MRERVHGFYLPSALTGKESHMIGSTSIFLLLYEFLVLGVVAVVVSAMLAVHAIRKDVRAIRHELTWLSDRIGNGLQP
jgi:hypothetical protein